MPLLDYTVSPDMNLQIPEVGITIGPNFATYINNSLTTIDSHNHTPGSGVYITTQAIDITASLTMNSYFLTDTAGVTLTAQSSTPANYTIYAVGNDLYYVNGAGLAIQVTNSTGLNVTPTSIPGLVAPASATYVPISSTFVWESNTNIAANMDFGAAIMRNLSPNSTYALTLQPPTLTSNYTITLPYIGSTNSVVTMDTSGTMSTQNINTLMPTGAVIMFPSASAPSGYLNCDGTSYSTASYPALFSYLGYTYGGSGSNFNVPNFQGLFPRSIGSQSGYSGPTIGSTQAQSTAVNGLSATSPPHTHTTTQYTNSNTGTFLSNSVANLNPTTLTLSSTAVTVNLSGDTETRPGNFGINFCIKT